MNTAISGVPFLDLVTLHEELKEELCGVFKSALGTAAFVGGPMVEEFEQEFAKFCDAKYCVGVANGTDALKFALIAAGVRSGNTVITVPNTFIATAEAISHAGAVPAFVDIDERTYNMDPEKLREYFETECYFDADRRKPISRATGRPVTAIVPVHLYGQPADIDPIQDIAKRYNLILIEDACQAHGAEYFSRKDNRWKKAGSMGKAAAFSFYPGKNLGACGEAGAVTTQDEELAHKIRMLRDHGQAQKYYHDIEGYNGRLDAIQAGFLRIKLNYLAQWNEQRRTSAQHYRELLGSMEEHIKLPFEPSWARSVYHLFVVRVAERDRLQRHLAEAQISTGIHYPIPLHRQKAYRELFYKEGDFPIAEKAAKEVLSLPMYPGLQYAQQRQVAETMMDFTCARQSGAHALAASST